MLIQVKNTIDEITHTANEIDLYSLQIVYIHLMINYESFLYFWFILDTFRYRLL